MSIHSYKNKVGPFDIINNIFMIFLSLITLFPFYYIVIISFANYENVRRQLLYLLPTSFNLDAYEMVFNENMFVNSFFISIFITVTGTLLSILISSAAAYTLSKKRIPGWSIMFTIIMIPMFFSGGLIPYYLTLKNVGLMNKIWVMILPAAVSSFYLLLLKNFFEELPASIEESARIDGANDIYILYRIVLPMSAPVIATISLFYAVDRWNDYYTALLCLNDRKLYPLQLILREVVQNFTQIKASAMGAAVLQANHKIYDESLKMAIITLSTIPILALYPFLQKHFTKGIIFGAVKE